MKVLLTHERFAPDFAGGGEYVVLELARNLIRAGVDVRVLTMGDPSQTDYEGIPTLRWAGHRYSMNLRARSIAEHARDVDLIQTFNYHACYPSLRAGQRLGKPVVCQFLALFGDAWRAMRGPVTGRLFEWWERFLLRQPYQRSVFLSEYSLNLGRSLGAPLKDARIIPPGIDLHHYGPTWPKEDTVLFVGKFDVRKGVDDILALARRMPDVSFVLYGWGEREAELRAKAPANLAVVAFERGQPLYERFARARIFLFPSRAETFGVAIVESMASGCAVVSSIPVAFDGVVIPPGDLEAMETAVRKLWTERETCEQMGRANIERARRFTWDECVRATLSLYEEVLASR